MAGAVTVPGIAWRKSVATSSTALRAEARKSARLAPFFQALIPPISNCVITRVSSEKTNSTTIVSIRVNPSRRPRKRLMLTPFVSILGVDKGAHRGAVPRGDYLSLTVWQKARRCCAYRIPDGAGNGRQDDTRIERVRPIHKRGGNYYREAA